MIKLFDPAGYANLRKPLLSAEGLPAACYHDAAFYRAELERIFHRGWHMVGRGDRIPTIGDYFAAAIGDVPVIIVRTRDATIRAFVNACRHRGTPLVEGQGNARAFSCPYHAWVYTLDGDLHSAVGMEETHDFLPAEHGLVPVRLEQWGGFLFACANPAAPPLANWLGDLPERLAPYRFDDMVGTRRYAYTVKCNWKLWVENFMEGYHVATVHRSTLRRQKVVNIPEDPGGGQYVSIYERHEGTRALLHGDAGFPPIESLTDDSAAGSRFILIYPATMLAIANDAAWALVCDPLGAEQTRVHVTYCFPKSRCERPDFEQVAANYYKRVEITLPEDNEICERQQIGLRSPLQRPGRFSHKEKIVHALDNWIVDRVVGPTPPIEAAAK
ncbi:MAG: aromatic ring-hydroxylating dioxygenase subunit alpha [Alphaproteobacteria bacterium]|nr:aromatic ring-hydroxylating dioxygenase subunit alpha [Alphaproteobacteria bacterium]